MNRRQILIGGVTVVGASAAGGAWLLASDVPLKPYIEGIVRSNLPGVHIEQQGLERYAADKIAEIGDNSAYKKIYAAVRSIGIDVTTLSGRLKEKVDAFEREVVSDFLIRSNFFLVPDPRKERIEYDPGRVVACKSPFAVLT